MRVSNSVSTVSPITFLGPLFPIGLGNWLVHTELCLKHKHECINNFTAHSIQSQIYRDK